MKRIAIVEDEKEEAERLGGFLQRYGEENDEKFEIVVFKDAVALLTNYRSIYDIIFMDIQMPNMNGMEASFKLRELDSVVTLIFVTNMTQFAAKGYEVRAFRFLLKPVTYSDFSLCMKKVLAKIDSDLESDLQIPISLPTGTKRISASELIYAEVVAHHITFHTENGDIETSGTLKEVEALLSKADFFRCNNCYLINLKYVSEINGYDVTVGGRRLTVSHPRRKDFLKALNCYLGR